YPHYFLATLDSRVSEANELASNVGTDNFEKARALSEKIAKEGGPSEPLKLLPDQGAGKKTVPTPAEVSAGRDKISAKEFDEGVGMKMGLRVANGVPTIAVKTSTAGERQQFLVFPDDYGIIYVGNMRLRANGPILIQPEQWIIFKLNALASLNPNTLQNLTS